MSALQREPTRTTPSCHCAGAQRQPTYKPRVSYLLRVSGTTSATEVLRQLNSALALDRDRA
jgi:hypothetical protein